MSITLSQYDPTKINRVELMVAVNLKGFMKPGETREQACARIALETEIRINQIGDIRAQVEFIEEVEV